MAHLVIIEDAQGDVADALVYCSDFCAQTSPAYAGWSGAHELDFHTPCTACNSLILGVAEWVTY